MVASVPRRPLARNVVANLVNAATTIAASVLALPLILHYVGIDGFGVWTLAQTAVVYIATAETGFGPAVQRYVSVAHGARDPRTAARIVWSASAFYVALGVVAAVGFVVLAPSFVTLFDVPEPLRSDAESMLRLIGPVLLLALVAAGLANVLQGVERFVAATAATSVSAVTFLVVAVILFAAGNGLVALGIAALAQYGVGVILRIWLLRDLLAAAPFGRVTRQEARGLLSFSARMQINVLSTLVNSQTDKIVVGLIATTAAVGEVGIGAQVAEAMRFLAFAALGPSIARMAISHGQGDAAVLGRLYHRLNGVWLPATAGAVLVACGAIYPLVAAWLGPGYGDAALYGAVLTVAYGINAMIGPGVAYLRAIGKPGLEARYGGLVISLNLAATILLGLAFGPIGVVSATTFAYALGTGWFMWRLRTKEPPDESSPPEATPGSRWLVGAIALLAGAMTLVWGLLALELTPRVVAVVLVAAGAGAALVGFIALLIRIRPGLIALPSLRRFAVRPQR